MKPTIGRIVHYCHKKAEPPHPAIITAVHAKDAVDLTVFRPRGMPYHCERIAFGTAKQQGAWSWPEIVPPAKPAPRAREAVLPDGDVVVGDEGGVPVVVDLHGMKSPAQ
jgi:hypothetical protein